MAITVDIQPVNPPGPAISFGLMGDSTYQPASTSSSGGLQIVDRPRLVASVQWYDRSPMELDLPLCLDSSLIYGNYTTSIEDLCLTIDEWQDKAPGQQQPPVLSVSGPIPGIQHQWMIYQVVFNEAIRDPNAGFRIQQNIQLTLYEYNSALAAIVGSPSPATAAQQLLASQEAAQSYSLYTVSAGQTLAMIAAATLGDYTQWTTLATLNNIRDPNNLAVGQVIKIPQL